MTEHLTHSDPHGAPPLAVVDVVASLLEAEQNSVFRFLAESWPYANAAAIELRRPIQNMVADSFRRAEELNDLLDSLGSTPAPRGVEPEEQYLAFLSFKFLLPKLIDAKKLMIRRYRNSLAAIPAAPAQVLDVLKRQLSEHDADLELLSRVATVA